MYTVRNNKTGKILGKYKTLEEAEKIHGKTYPVDKDKDYMMWFGKQTTDPIVITNTGESYIERNNQLLTPTKGTEVEANPTYNLSLDFNPNGTKRSALAKSIGGYDMYTGNPNYYHGNFTNDFLKSLGYAGVAGGTIALPFLSPTIAGALTLYGGYDGAKNWVQDWHPIETFNKALNGDYWGAAKDIGKVGWDVLEAAPFVGRVMQGAKLLANKGVGTGMNYMINRYSPNYTSSYNWRTGKFNLSPRVTEGANPISQNNISRRLLIRNFNKSVKNWDGTVDPEYFRSPDRWYRITTSPEIYGIKELGINVTTRDLADFPNSANSFREFVINTGLLSGTGINEGYWIYPLRLRNAAKQKILNAESGEKQDSYKLFDLDLLPSLFRKLGSAHGNRTQASWQVPWAGTTAATSEFPKYILEGIPLHNLTIPYGVRRSNFKLLPIEEVPLGGRVGFKTGEMPLEELRAFRELPNGRFRYEGTIVPNKTIRIKGVPEVSSSINVSDLSHPTRLYYYWDGTPKSDWSNPNIYKFTDNFGNEVTPTPYTGDISDFLDATQLAQIESLKHYFSREKIKLIKETMGWGDTEMNEFLDELLRLLSTLAKTEVKNSNTMKDIAFHSGAIIGSGNTAIGKHTITYNKDRIPSYNDILESAIHELGGHGATAGLDPEKYGINANIDKIKLSFPRTSLLMEKNKEIADEILKLNDRGIKASAITDINSPEKKRFNYINTIQELRARGFTLLLMDKLVPGYKTLNIKQLEDFYTPESVETFKNKLLQFTLPLAISAGTYLNSKK